MVSMNVLVLVLLGVGSWLVKENAAGLMTTRRPIYVREKAPSQWAKGPQALPSEMVSFHVALRQQNLDVLEKLFWQVSDPNSPQYKHYKTIDEIMDIVAPPESTQKAVKNWLLDNGVNENDIKMYQDVFHVRASVQQVQEIFQTTMYTFTSKHSGTKIIRQMGEYSVPLAVYEYVEMVTGLSDFPMPRSSSLKKVRQATDSYVIPQTISTLYNFPAGLKADPTKSSQCAVEFQDDSSFSYSDLAKFESLTGTETENISHVVGPFDGQWADVEATLDIQYLTAVGKGADNWYWTEKKWMYDFSCNFFNTKKVPMVISMSWGWNELAQCDVEQDTCSILGINSATYVARTNVEFQKIGLRGVSIVVASGDSGANGRTDSDCSGKTLHPIFPGGSPYVTAVGATELKNPTIFKNAPPVCSSKYSCANGGQETAVTYGLSGFTSGGGFSSLSQRPTYQDFHVKNYLNTAPELPPSSYFAAKGRAYPDVASLGHNYLCYIDGEIMPVGGTSASAPAFAGVLALLNSELGKDGQGPIGFANPLLYQMQRKSAATFKDVVEGDNKCTEYGCKATCKGFVAAKGWDPVSGLGTPDVTEILNYVKSLYSKPVAKQELEAETKPQSGLRTRLYRYFMH